MTKDYNTREDVTDQFPKVGESGPAVDNVSGAVKMIGSTRHAVRDTTGKFKPRASRLVGPLGPPGGVGPGGIDTVTGQFIPGVRNRAQLQDLERVHEISASAGPYMTFDSQSTSDEIASHALRAVLFTEADRIDSHNSNTDFATRRP